MLRQTIVLLVFLGLHLAPKQDDGNGARVLPDAYAAGFSGV